MGLLECMTACMLASEQEAGTLRNELCSTILVTLRFACTMASRLDRSRSVHATPLKCGPALQYWSAQERRQATTL